MEWTAIADLIPGRLCDVLLYAKHKGVDYYNLGTLGKSRDVPEVTVRADGMRYPVTATHWCRLEPPGKSPR